VFRYKSSLLLAQLGDSCSTPRRPARFVLIFGPSLGVGWGLWSDWGDADAAGIGLPIDFTLLVILQR